MFTQYLIDIDDMEFKNIYEKTFPINEKVTGSITWLKGLDRYDFVAAFADKIVTWHKTWNEWDELVNGVDDAIQRGYGKQCIIRALKRATTTVCVPHVYIFLYFCIYITKYNWCLQEDLMRNIEKLEDNRKEEEEEEEEDNVFIGTKISIDCDTIKISGEKILMNETNFWTDLKGQHTPFIIYIDEKLGNMNTKLWQNKAAFAFVGAPAKLVYKFPNSQPNTYIGLVGGGMDFDGFVNKTRNDNSLNYDINNQSPNQPANQPPNQPPNGSNDNTNNQPPNGSNDNTNNQPPNGSNDNTNNQPPNGPNDNTNYQPPNGPNDRRRGRNRDRDRDRDRRRSRNRDRHRDRDRDRDRDRRRSRNRDRDRDRNGYGNRDRDRYGNGYGNRDRYRDRDRDRYGNGHGNRDRDRSRSRSPN